MMMNEDRSTSRTIDLRADTVTLPTQEMREAMYRAEVGDDLRGEDPTVCRLQELCAERCGFEAGLFAQLTPGRHQHVFAPLHVPAQAIVFAGPALFRRGTAQQQIRIPAPQKDRGARNHLIPVVCNALIRDRHAVALWGSAKRHRVR